MRHSRTKIIPVAATILAFCLVILAGCYKDPPNTPSLFPGKTLIATWPVRGAAVSIEIWNDGPLKDGYAPLYMVLRDSLHVDQLVPDAHIMMMPMVDGLGSGVADAPYEEPEGSDVEGRFQGAVLFPFAGPWILHTTVHNHLNNQEAEVMIPVTVNLATPTERYQFSDPDDSATSTLIAWAPTTIADHVGYNDMELVIFTHQANGRWTPDSSHTFTIKTEMPSMGHGSDGNVEPTHRAKGHYFGKVNFTMAGEWTVTAETFRNGVSVTTPYVFLRTVK